MIDRRALLSSAALGGSALALLGPGAAFASAPERFGVPRFATHAEQWSAVALHDHSWAQRRRVGMPMWRHAVEALRRIAKR